MTEAPGRARVVAIAAVLLLCCAASQFARNSHAVVAPDIAAELGLPVQALGTIGGVLFLAAALTMIPFGGLFDAVGARPVLAGKLALCAVGALAFGWARSLDGLVVGRVLLGIGSAALIMGALVVASRWYPPHAFGTIVGLTLATSHVGNLAATVPFAAVVGWLGWRHAFDVVALALAACAVAVWWLVRDAPPGHAYHTTPRPRVWASMRGVGAVLKLPGLRPVLAMGLCAYAGFSAVLAVWAGPFLRDRFGLDADARSRVLLAMALGIIAGNLLYAAIERRGLPRKRVAQASALANIAILVWLALRAPWASLPETVVAFTLLAALNCYTTTLIAHGRSLYPDPLIGRGMTTMNCCAVGGAALLQIGSAQVARPFGTAAGGLEPAGYSLVFAVLAAWVSVGLWIYRRAPESRPRAGPSAAHAAGPASR
jgi:predicted MFS family arabinose efflux permease